LSVADGAIVGSALKVDGRAENAIDPARAQAIVAAWRKAT
jgi:predicted TIM-barrel enzyme